MKPALIGRVASQFGLILAVAFSPSIASSPVCAVSLCSFTHRQAQAKPDASASDQQSVYKLILQLGSKAFDVRQNAAEKLTAMGTLAIPGLRQGLENPDPEVRKRCEAIFESIMSTRISTSSGVVNGAEFTLFADSVWSSPKPGHYEPVRIFLKITNQVDKPQSFYLFDTINLKVSNLDGQRMPTGYGMDHLLNGPRLTRSLAKGESVIVKLVARLRRSEDGTALSLDVEDGFGGLWMYGGLELGKYLLAVGYANDDQEVPAKDRLATWKGEALTKFMTIEIQ